MKECPFCHGYYVVYSMLFDTSSKPKDLIPFKIQYCPNCGHDVSEDDE